MPELPEVEALRAFLAQQLTGHTVERVLPVAISVLKTFAPPLTALEGQQLGETARYGKFLAVPAGELWLVTHLARAGWLRWRERVPAQPPHPGRGPLALRVVLTDGSGFDLTEAGTHKRLAVHVVRDPKDVPALAGLGPDPLAAGFGPAQFAALLKGERRQIKGILRDQRVLAGIGNAYSDEILHAARMSPFKLADRLDEAELTRLYEAMEGVLHEAVERSRGLAVGQLKAEKKTGLRVHGRAGERCPVCEDTIRSVSFADSSLQYCPTCQTGGRPLADRRLSRLLR
ncbi:Fpg/Nei family DNA glycosylase [Streptomyces sp. NPDC006879]|uniref:Fpg/Nei family DNA glycosylase n=1 Tax=Streptomyces sp. NPDC006879 TaxID=3364767 RepID=UPI00367A1B25